MRTSTLVVTRAYVGHRRNGGTICRAFVRECVSPPTLASVPVFCCLTSDPMHSIIAACPFLRIRTALLKNPGKEQCHGIGVLQPL